MMFRRRKTSQPYETVRNPLVAIPLIPAGVEAGIDDLDLVQVRREHTPRTRIGRTAVRWLGQRYARRTRLDERGSFYWKQINGRRTLHEIADRLGDQFELAPTEARQAVMLFTKMLMLRNLISLKIDAQV
jgi:hypothetical protein